MENRKDVTVPMPGDMVNDIDSHLEYGDSRSQWIREAVQQRLDRLDESGKGNAVEPAAAD